MFDLKHNRSKHYKSVTKSNTTVALPEIRKINNKQIQRERNNSGYLETIAYLSSNVDYERKNTEFVNKQQNTLKSILKKMNSDTMELINHIKPKKNLKGFNKELQNQTVEKQVENRQKLIHILEIQIEQLKEKYKLIVEQHEDVEVGKKIVSIKEQIEQLRQENVDRKAKMNKEGKEIQKYSIQNNNDSKLFGIEIDHQMAMSRLQKLKGQSSKVEQQNNKLISKTQELQPFLQQLQQQCKKIKSKQSQQAVGKSRQYQQTQRKTQIQMAKKRIDFIKQTSQVKYYKLLKELQSQRVNAKSMEVKTTQLQTRTKLAKQQIISLQSMLDEIKRKKKEKGQRVMEYLASSRKLTQGDDSRVLSDIPIAVQEVKTQRLKSEEEILRQLPSKQSKTQELKISRLQVKVVKQEQHLSEPKSSDRQQIDSKKYSETKLINLVEPQKGQKIEQDPIVEGKKEENLEKQPQND